MYSFVAAVGAHGSFLLVIFLLLAYAAGFLFSPFSLRCREYVWNFVVAQILSRDEFETAHDSAVNGACLCWERNVAAVDGAVAGSVDDAATKLASAVQESASSKSGSCSGISCRDVEVNREYIYE